MVGIAILGPGGRICHAAEQYACSISSGLGAPCIPALNGRQFYPWPCSVCVLNTDQAAEGVEEILLGIEVIDGVEGITVRDAVSLYVSGGPEAIVGATGRDQADIERIKTVLAF